MWGVIHTPVTFSRLLGKTAILDLLLPRWPHFSGNPAMLGWIRNLLGIRKRRRTQEQSQDRKLSRLN